MPARECEEHRQVARSHSPRARLRYGRRGGEGDALEVVIGGAAADAMQRSTAGLPTHFPEAIANAGTAAFPCIMADRLFELVTVPSGARSLRSLESGEVFHPGIGPIEEARILHVDQHRLQERLRSGGNFEIWDVGLGGAANAIAILQAVLRQGANSEHVFLRSFDLDLEPLRYTLEHAGELKYPEVWKQQIAVLLAEGKVEIGPVTWVVEEGDFRELVETCKGAPAAVLYDPYSPAANPGMWTEEVFRAIRSRAGAECTLTSYSRSTVVRARMMLAGWYVGRGVATGEKTETTVAATRLGLLREPLTREWLTRVRRSSAAGLRQDGGTAQSVADQLEEQPQMRVGISHLA